MDFKTGRKPARYTRKSFARGIVMARALDSLGLPPSASSDYVMAVDKITGGDWGMDGNDTAGDCTCASTAHQLMLHSANAGTMIQPTAEQTLALYSAITGFNPADPSTDQGADELSVIEYLEKTGWLGTKDTAAANIDPLNIAHLKWGVQLFGAARLGVNLPQSAMDQFNAGQPWDVIANDGGIIGGHDVPIVKYDASGVFYIVTWAKLQPMTPAFVAKYVEEAHCEMNSAWIEAGGLGASGIDGKQLIADLQQVQN